MKCLQSYFSGGLMKDLQPYLDHLSEDEKTPAMIAILKWYAEYDPKVPADNAVHFAHGSILKIKDLIAGFQALYPEYPIDLMLLDIFHSLKENDPIVWVGDSKSRKYFSKTLQLAYQLHKNHLYHLPEKIKGEYDNLDIQVIIFLLQNVPDFKNGLNSNHFYRLKSFLQDYVNAAPFRTSHLNQEQIRLYFWVLKTYPLVAKDFEKTASWVSEIARSKNYRRTSQLFPNTYPFHHISFETVVDGKAILYINSKTQLYVEPIKKCLSVFPESYDTRVHFDGPFDSAEYLIATLEAIFEKVENEILYNNFPKKLFHETKKLIINAAHQFYRDYQADFPGLKLLQLHPPGVDREENDARAGILYRCIKNNEITQLRDYLSTGLDPHTRIYHGALLDFAVDTLRCYSIQMLNGKPKFSSVNGKDSDHLKALKSQYNVIISKQHDHFYLHWMTENNICYEQQITLASDIAYLQSLKPDYFKPDGALRSSSSCSERDRLNAMIEKFFVSTLEIERRNAAQKIIATTTLLLEFGADPSHTKDGNHPGSRTVLESLVYNACSFPMDKANKLLVTELIMLLLRFDKQQSHLIVSTEYRDHFVGKTLENGRNALVLSKEIPKIIQAKITRDENKIMQLRFENSKNNVVYLKTTRLKQLFEEAGSDLMGVVDLFYKKFPHYRDLDPNKIQESLQSNSQNTQDFIDLVTNQEGQIVGFSTTQIVAPTKAKECSLHLVPLAACEEDVSKDFSRLMSIISFRRIETLQIRYQCLVLTSFLAASASSYLQISDLQSHPKYRCLQESDWIRLRDHFYKDREIIIEEGVHYIRSDLYYVNEDKKQDFPTPADINRQAFNSRYSKPGFGTLVAFYSTPRNMTKLAGIINSRLETGLSFAEIARESACLDRQPGLPSASL